MSQRTQRNGDGSRERASRQSRWTLRQSAPFRISMVYTLCVHPRWPPPICQKMPKNGFQQFYYQPVYTKPGKQNAQHCVNHGRELTSQAAFDKTQQKRYNMINKDWAVEGKSTSPSHREIKLVNSSAQSGLAHPTFGRPRFQIVIKANCNEHREAY